MKRHTLKIQKDCVQEEDETNFSKQLRIKTEMMELKKKNKDENKTKRAVVTNDQKSVPFGDIIDDMIK